MKELYYLAIMSPDQQEHANFYGDLIETPAFETIEEAIECGKRHMEKAIDRMYLADCILSGYTKGKDVKRGLVNAAIQLRKEWPDQALSPTFHSVEIKIKNDAYSSERRKFLAIRCVRIGEPNEDYN